MARAAQRSDHLAHGYSVGMNMMSEPRPLNIPVILGTSRKGRASVHAANLLADLLNRRDGVSPDSV